MTAERWHAVSHVTDGKPGRLRRGDVVSVMGKRHLSQAHRHLSHPGLMLRRVKEGLARLINRENQAAGHAWECRFHDVRLLDAGGVLACLVYVDLNEDAPLAKCLWRLDGTMLIDPCRRWLLTGRIPPRLGLPFPPNRW